MSDEPRFLVFQDVEGWDVWDGEDNRVVSTHRTYGAACSEARRRNGSDAIVHGDACGCSLCTGAFV